MAQVIWTEPARVTLEAIAEYIALDNPETARRVVQRVYLATKQLVKFPRSGSRIPEAPRERARQLVLKPFRIFYRIDGKDILVLHVVRNEQKFRQDFLAS